MRVIAGRFRSRVLAAPAGMDTRPTSDRLRETLFNVLTQGAVDLVEGTRFLDLYAGSGAVGMEALSRGAESVTFVEQDAGALAVLSRNLATLGLTSSSKGPIRVEKSGVGRYLRAASKGDERYGVVFLDPPYADEHAYAETLGLLGGQCAGLISAGAMVVAEHARKRALAATYGKLVRVRKLEQGDSALSFYQRRGINEAPAPETPAQGS